MAYAEVLLTNGVEVKKVPIGFSWTVFLFGGWPPLFRQDWLWGAILMLGSLMTYGFAGVICAFFYNKVYAKGLFEKGYYVHSLPPTVTEEGLKNYLGYMTLPGKK